MNILFIHQSFPGQFGNLAASFAQDKANRVVALAINRNPVPPGVELRTYSLLRQPAPETHPFLVEEEAKILRAEACAAAAFQLQRDGFYPDVIVAHPGWGEALFIKEVFPRARLVIYCEYYYKLEGQDVGFDPEVPPLNYTQRCKLALRNSTNLLSLEMADAAYSPTEWQRSTYPAWAAERIQVIHDGVDLNKLAFRPDATLTLTTPREPGGLVLRPGDEVLSYVARNLEPVRGFHIFMRALPEILAKRPQARVIVVGGDEVSYGHRPPGGVSWRDHLTKEFGSAVDLGRVHFVGKVPHPAYLSLLSISRVHAYLTTPFVLSWSFLEAAMSGLPVIGSATAPVLEFAEELKVQTRDFFDAKGFAEAITEQLTLPSRGSSRAPVPCARVELARCLSLQHELIKSL